MNIVSPDHARRLLQAAEEYFDYLFENAPVMMHTIGQDGRLIRVNHRWLEELGYEREEVLGRKSIDFLTAESQVRALRDTLPLFWRVGSARSIGYQILRKDRQVLDVLLDAELVSIPGGAFFCSGRIVSEP